MSEESGTVVTVADVPAEPQDEAHLVWGDDLMGFDSGRLREEVGTIFNSVDALVRTMEKITTAPLSKLGDSALLLRIVVPLRVTVENMLPQLRSIADALEDINDERCYELSASVNHIEDMLVDLIGIIGRLDRNRAASAQGSAAPSSST